MNYTSTGYMSIPATSNREFFKSVTRATVAAIGLVLGTGSVAPSTNYNDRHGNYRPVNPTSNLGSRPIAKLSPEVADLITVEQHLKKIKTHIGLSISELSGFLGVTRQAIYKWQAGLSTPDTENIMKVRELSRLADGLAEAKVSRPSDLVKAKAFNGSSILDLMKRDEDYSESLAALIKEYRVLDASYTASKISFLKGAGNSDWKSSISVPSANEV